MRGKRIFAATILVISSVTAAMPAFADFGAIAWDQRSCAVGRSWHYYSPRDAAERALAECGSPGCRIALEVGSGQCGALAVTSDCRGYGWATRGSRDGASYAAMMSCQGYNAGQCSIRTVDCNH
jgi:hypothetical protein